MLALAGLTSGVLSTFAFLPYIFDTLAGRTRPQRASWLIWSILGTIAFFSLIYEGATHSLWFVGVQVASTIVIFTLSVCFGFGRFLTRGDTIILMAAAVGLLLWAYTDTAVYALAITISISLLGGSTTVIKAYRDPDSETISTWLLSALASICAVLAVGQSDWVLLAYPLYLCTLSGAIVVAMVLGRVTAQAPTGGCLPVLMTSIWRSD